VKTDTEIGLPERCGLTRFWTEGALGGPANQGVKLPADPGNNNFEVYINS